MSNGIHLQIFTNLPKVRFLKNVSNNSFKNNSKFNIFHSVCDREKDAAFSKIKKTMHEDSYMVLHFFQVCIRRSPESHACLCI